MRLIRLKCTSDEPSYDQSIHAVSVEREDDANWYGAPADNPNCPDLGWPKFAWKEVSTDDLSNETGQESTRDARLTPGTNLSTRSGGKIDALTI